MAEVVDGGRKALRHTGLAERLRQFADLRGWPAVALLAVLTVATLIDVRRSDTTSLWLDEAFTAGLARQPLHIFWQGVWAGGPNMALYYVLVAGWMHILAYFGQPAGNLMLRAPSIVAAVLSVALLWRLGWRLLTPLLASTAAALYATNYMQLMEAAQARSYSLALLLVIGSWYCFVAAIDSTAPRWRWWCGYAFSAALGVYAHLIVGLVVAAQLLAYAGLLFLPTAWRQSARASLPVASAAFAAVFVLCVPIGLVVIVEGGSNSWVSSADSASIIRLSGAMTAASPIYAAGLGAACILAVVQAFRMLRRGFESRPAPLSNRSSTRQLATIWILVCWLTLPLVLSFGASQSRLNLHLFLTRYMVVSVPALCLLATAGLSMIRFRFWRSVVALALVAASLPGVSLYYERVQREDLEGAISWVSRQYEAGDGVACLSLGCSLAIEEYAPTVNSSTAPGYYDWSTLRTNSVDPAVVDAYAESHRRVFLIMGAAGQRVDYKPLVAELGSKGRLAGTWTSSPGSAGVVRVWLFETTATP